MSNLTARTGFNKSNKLLKKTKTFRPKMKNL